MPPEPDFVTILLAIFTGLGLAAACGLRVFLPLFVLGFAVRSGSYEVVDDFRWIGSTPALVSFGAATTLEILAFYVPWLDNLLDLVALPLAAIAGALATTSVLVGMDPWMHWTLGIVAGAGVATIIHVPMSAARAASTATTGGAANAAVSTSELAGAGLVSGMAVFAPIASPMVVIALVAGSIHLVRKKRREKA